MKNCRKVALVGLSALALGIGCQPQPVSDEVSVEYGALATTKSALVNLLGYAPGAQKIAVVVSSNAAAGKVEVLNSGGAVVWPTSGTQNTVFKGTDNNSGDAVHHADFTAFQTVGTGYKLRVTIPAAGGTVFDSEAFDIGTDLLGTAALPKSAMKYYYYHRQGMALASARLDQGGSTAFAHSGLHVDDNTLTGYPNAGSPWSTTTFNVVGGWSDAGDFGKYADNQAMAAWLLMNLFERYKSTPLGTTGYGLNIDESGNLIPDLLDEIAWGSKTMRGMLPNPTTRVSNATVNDLAAHKCHNTSWSAYPSTAATENSNYCNGASCGGDDNNRYCMGSSTTATYGVARNLAQLARLLDPPGSVGYDDATTATDYYNVAKEAYGRAGGIYPGGSQTAAPLKLFNKNDTTQSPGGDTGGGPYDDADADDDKYAAAVELYLTACARGDTTAVTAYKAHVTANAYYKQVAYFDWGTEASLGDAMGDDAAVGTLSLLSAHDTYCVGANALPSADLTTMRDNLKAYADTLAGNIIGQNYPSAIGNSATVYPWGSNKVQAYGGLVLVLAYEKITPQDKRYLRAAFRLFDYLFGVNPVRQSFVTGLPVETGTCCFETDTHNRLGANGTTWPKGWLAGGPLNVSHTDTSTPQTGPIMKRYAANGTNATAWASKEDTIDWNGGLASLAYALDFYETALPADAGPNCNDGMKNGTEVDVDCRGSCTAKCFNGQACTTGADCIGGSCVGNVCAPPPPPQNPFGGTARPVPGTIQVEDYDTGGQNVAYSDSDSTNQGGAYRADGVDIEATTDTGGGFNIGYVAAGEWLEYTVSVASTASYSLTVRVATPNSGKSLHVESDGANVSGSIAVPNTGGWQTWQTVTVPAVSLTAGTHVLRLAFDTDLINANWFAFAGGGGPSCFDGIKNGSETDIDCGGSCAADCADGKLCAVGADCTGGNCVSGTCCTVLGAPTGLSATPGNAQVSLSWTAVAGAESTNIKRSTTSGSGYATVGTSTTTSHVDPGLTNGTTYYYVTTAVNTCGPVSTESANSSEVSATPSAGGGCTPQTPNCEYQMSGGVASVEGEHWFVNSTTGVTTGDSWSQAAAAPASGGQCMVVGPDNGNSWTTNVTTTSPRLDFKVNFTAGTFFLHIRGDGSNGSNDSCWGGRDGTLLTTVYDYPETVNTWAWRSVSLGSVTAGIHTINVWGREDGFRLDKIVINTSSTAPTGAGPAESVLN